jgi:hypothetical protein
MIADCNSIFGALRLGEVIERLRYADHSTCVEALSSIASEKNWVMWYPVSEERIAAIIQMLRYFRARASFDHDRRNLRYQAP